MAGFSFSWPQIKRKPGCLSASLFLHSSLPPSLPHSHHRCLLLILTSLGRGQVQSILRYGQFRAGRHMTCMTSCSRKEVASEADVPGFALGSPVFPSPRHHFTIHQKKATLIYICSMRADTALRGGKAILCRPAGSEDLQNPLS